MNQAKAVRKVMFWMKFENLIDPEHEARIKEYLTELTALAFWEGTRHYGNINSKAIVQYDLKGVKINEYENQLIAAKAVGYSDRAILRSLKSKKKTRAGHIWKYADNGTLENNR
jgi:hypothetical protein